MQDASTGLTEPFTQPLAICKRWLLNLFPLLRNEELVSRVAWTLMIIAIARLGLYLKLPYVDSRFAPRNAIVCKPLSASSQLCTADYAVTLELADALQRQCRCHATTDLLMQGW